MAEMEADLGPVWTWSLHTRDTCPKAERSPEMLHLSVETQRYQVLKISEKWIEGYTP